MLIFKGLNRIWRHKQAEIRLYINSIIYTKKATQPRGYMTWRKPTMECNFIMIFMGERFFWVCPGQQRRSCWPWRPATAGGDSLPNFSVSFFLSFYHNILVGRQRLLNHWLTALYPHWQARSLQSEFCRLLQSGPNRGSNNVSPSR